MKETLTLLAIVATYLGLVTYLWFKVEPIHKDNDYEAQDKNI